eukprot:TRINITY_DN5468_c0_g1_i1.p1 TRINITY_DN5468_c0_g1~~TRINITY_DN5468_c0_g1_i1.p1  ORF type:complete len:272 (-),score=17.52 TRINITY_DN5468_c0_g1_i1:33-848(-)
MNLNALDERTSEHLHVHDGNMASLAVVQGEVEDDLLPVVCAGWVEKLGHPASTGYFRRWCVLRGTLAPTATVVGSAASTRLCASPLLPLDTDSQAQRFTGDLDSANVPGHGSHASTHAAAVTADVVGQGASRDGDGLVVRVTPPRAVLLFYRRPPVDGAGPVGAAHALRKRVPLTAGHVVDDDALSACGLAVVATTTRRSPGALPVVGSVVSSAAACPAPGPLAPPHASPVTPDTAAGSHMALSTSVEPVAACVSPRPAAGIGVSPLSNGS